MSSITTFSYVYSLVYFINRRLKCKQSYLATKIAVFCKVNKLI